MNFCSINHQIRNVLWMAGAVISIHSLYKLLTRLTKPSKKYSFLIDNRLYLYKNSTFTRSDIIELGRKAIRDPNTNKLLINPHVNPDDGLSYSSPDDHHHNHNNHPHQNDSDNYENRNLKQFIEYYCTPPQ